MSETLTASRSVLAMQLPLDCFMTSLYCEDDLDEGAFEVGIEAIRAARVHRDCEALVEALHAVVEAKAGDGRYRKARQLHAALDEADLALRAERACDEDDTACHFELHANDWCGLPRSHPIHDEDGRWGGNHPFYQWPDSVSEQPLAEGDTT